MRLAQVANEVANGRAKRMPSVTNSVSRCFEPGAKAANNVSERLGLEGQSNTAAKIGRLIVNADDWGRDRETTDRILHCTGRGTVSSASAMVFMQDSERAAALAQESKIDAGLHLNLTLAFSSPECPLALLERQRSISAYLLRHSLAQIVLHPGLASSFDYVVKAQLDEFSRLYGAPPSRIDGHHHMHLSANVVFGALLPAGALVRRNFSFRPGEKSFANRMYRKFIDGRLARRHQLIDYLFTLLPLNGQRLRRIANLARNSVVEVETHPINADEYEFLTNGDAERWSADVPIAPSFAVPVREFRGVPGDRS